MIDPRHEEVRLSPVHPLTFQCTITPCTPRSPEHILLLRKSVLLKKYESKGARHYSTCEEFDRFCMLSSTLSDRRYVTRPKRAGGYVNVTCHPNLHIYSAIVQAPLLSIFSVPQRTTEIALERRSVSKSTPMPKSGELALLDAINSASPTSPPVSL
jgi:hypothetical protein